MYKNVDNQKWTVFAFDLTDNTPKTGDAAQISAVIRIDGVENAVDDAHPTELSLGYYEFDITQAETNGDLLTIIPTSSTGDIQVIGVPGSVYANAVQAVVDHADYGLAKLVRSTTPANTLDISATGEAGLDFDNVKDATEAHTLTNITVPTVTTNTDMRGTDNAALASVLGALNDAAAEGAVTDADTLMQYIKQAITALIGDHGLVSIQDDIDEILTDTAELGAAVGASLSADIVAIKSVVDDILTDTGTTLKDILDTLVGNGTLSGVATKLMIDRLYCRWNHEVNVDDSDGSYAIRNAADDADIATGDITDDDSDTQQTAVAWS